ncbi:transposase family [Shigella sonnei]|nr:transposase family [Shigella sonnei]
MSRKTQRYSKEFKAEAVRTVPENQLSISEGFFICGKWAAGGC